MQKSMRERFDTAAAETAQVRMDAEKYRVNQHLLAFAEGLPSTLDYVVQAFENNPQKGIYPDGLREYDGLSFDATLSFYLSPADIMQTEGYAKFVRFCSAPDNNLNLSASIEYLAKDGEYGEVAKLHLEIEPFEEFRKDMTLDVIGQQYAETVKKKVKPVLKRR